MTVDRKRPLTCEWCRGKTDNYNCKYSEITEQHYCSEGCKDRAEEEYRAECDHFTAVNQTVIDGKNYGECEECRIELIEEDEIWKPV